MVNQKDASDNLFPAVGSRWQDTSLLALTAGLSLLSHELPSTLATEAEDILIVYFPVCNASMAHQRRDTAS